ncbi:MAG: HTH domain-containing protein [Longimicrobiales bacterium]
MPATTLRRFWQMLAHYHGHLWNGAELARAFGVSETAVRNYLDILTDGLVVRQLQPWFENVSKRHFLHAFRARSRVEVTPRHLPREATVCSTADVGAFVPSPTRATGPGGGHSMARRFGALVPSLASALILASLLGCGSGSRDQGVVVWDSAGVAIVENAAGQWGEGEGWRVSPEPILSIGEIEGAEPYQFYDLRGAFRLTTGEIVVADFTSNQIRWFDAGGAFLRSVGRQGGGPEEFDGIVGMWRLPGDSLAVADFGNDRMTVLEPDGELARFFQLSETGSFARPVGPFDDGSFLARMHTPMAEGEIGQGTHRDTVILLHWGPEGQTVDTLAGRPGQERYYGRAGGEDLAGAPPFARGFSVAPGSDSWYYGSTEAFEIEAYSRAGELERLIRRDVPAQPVTSQHLEAWQHETREAFRWVPAVFREWHANLPPRETLPAYGDFIVDEDDHLWVAEYSPEDQPVTWSVFDPDGSFLGSVEVPPGGTITQIGSDFVLGVWATEMDVEEVRMYRLRRDSEGPP